MTVDRARKEYQALESLALVHDRLCPLLGEPCELDRDAWLDVESAGLTHDLTTAAGIVGPHPVWIWPSWLFGQAYA